LSQATKQRSSKQNEPKPENTEISAITQQLESADEHIQLAVELIYLLESNEVSPNTVLKELDIVQSEFQNKLTT
jgi:L-asparaginase/Glu-tRNA(Gln) amidotransferase subunit D